jgi:hypothetical protein
MIICKSEPRISFGTQQQPYLFLSYLKNPYCFCLKLKKKPQNTHFQVYENFEFYSKKIEKNDFPCLEIMSILLGKCKIRKSKLYSYRLLSHCALHSRTRHLDKPIGMKGLVAYLLRSPKPLPADLKNRTYELAQI